MFFRTSYQHVAIYLRNLTFFSFLIKIPHQKNFILTPYFSHLHRRAYSLCNTSNHRMLRYNFVTFPQVQPGYQQCLWKANTPFWLIIFKGWQLGSQPSKQGYSRKRKLLIEAGGSILQILCTIKI